MTDSLRISELFYSIQGESTRAGLPCLFIRLAGCNLRCRYCDAPYTWDEPGTAMGQDEILDWVARIPGVMVELTGGEPLCQAGVYPLMRALIETGRTVLVETNGSLSLSSVPDPVHLIMDIKCPDSGMAAHNLEENIDLLRRRRARGCSDEIKFVLGSAADFDWARAKVERHDLAGIAPVLFSPVQPQFAPASLAQLLLDHRLPVRLQLQLHSLLWPDRTRGV